MARCARDTRDAELAESFVELKEAHLKEAVADPIGLLKCDIAITVPIPRFLSNHQEPFDSIVSFFLILKSFIKSN